MHGRAWRLTVIPGVDGEFWTFMWAIREVYGGRVVVDAEKGFG